MRTITKKTISAAVVASLVGLSSAAHAFTACQVTDIGGVDDKGFNATAWKGVQDAVAKHGIDSKLLESKSETDYMPHLSSFVAEGCDVIVSVGFLMGEATATAAKENSSAKFSIVDFAYDPTTPNVVGQVFATDQAAFLAGYLAAGVSKTGIVGTFGGINIPPVTGLFLRLQSDGSITVFCLLEFYINFTSKEPIVCRILMIFYHNILLNCDGTRPDIEHCVSKSYQLRLGIYLKTSFSSIHEGSAVLSDELFLTLNET